MNTDTPRTNPAARDPADVLGTTLPDTVSAVTWRRPYTYHLVRVDDGRLRGFDDHENPTGRKIRTLHTRAGIAGWKAIFSRQFPDREYRIVAEPNENYDPTS